MLCGMYVDICVCECLCVCVCMYVCCDGMYVCCDGLYECCDGMYMCVCMLVCLDAMSFFVADVCLLLCVSIHFVAMTRWLLHMHFDVQIQRHFRVVCMT